MDKFVIEGGVTLSGELEAGGSKNSSLPILFASILCSGVAKFTRVPQLKDIETTLKLLNGVGISTNSSGNNVEINARKISGTEASYDLVRTMRASILMLGPLLAREGTAKVSLPGGCAIGARPVDLHLTAMEALGAKLHLENGYVIGEAPGGLKGAEIPFRMPSVGATENAMMAASLAKGKSVIRNAAREPEIVDLARFLNRMGAKITGEGSSDITIEGVNQLHGTSYEIMFDRIEAATLLLAGLITGGDIKINGVAKGSLDALYSLLRNLGIEVHESGNTVSARGKITSGKTAEIQTEPFPGFATDLQAQVMSYLATSSCEATVTESIFENRFMHVPELNRLGADIRVEGPKAVVHGKPGCYQGAIVMATDLRASASLVMAGLAAKGTTQVRRIYHLDRGYERLEKKLEKLGARILRDKE